MFITWLNLKEYIYEWIFFARHFFEGVFQAMDDDKLQLPFLLHDLGIFFKMSGLPPSQKFGNFTETGNGKEGVHSIWSGSLVEELDLSQSIQNVIL